MPIQTIQQSEATALVVRLLDGSGDPVTGVAYTAITATYKKQGDTTYTTKTVQAAHWAEGPEGRYTLIFTSSELDTVGRFLYRVVAAGADVFTGDVDIVEDWADVVSMMESLLNQLGTKVSQESLVTAKLTQDSTIASMGTAVEQLRLEIEVIERQLNALRIKAQA